MKIYIMTKGYGMIEALILWGVVSGNNDRRREYQGDTDPGDYTLMFFFLLTIAVWPAVITVHILRLAYILRLWWVSLVAAIPVATGTLFIITESYLWYAALGILVSMGEMVRVSVRSIS
jgi:hypothetical protein